MFSRLRQRRKIQKAAEALARKGLEEASRREAEGNIVAVRDWYSRRECPLTGVACSLGRCTLWQEGKFEVFGTWFAQVGCSLSVVRPR